MAVLTKEFLGMTLTDASKISNKIKSDTAFKKQCSEFFQLALSKIWDRHSELRQNGPPFTRNNIIFQADDDLFRSANDLVRLCVNKLGPKIGDEKDVDKLMWRHVCDDACRTMSPAAIADEFIASLVKEANSAYTYVCANRLIRVHSSINRVQIGPVTVVVISDPAQDIFDGKVDPTWAFKIGREYEFSIKSGIEIQIPPTCWKVSTHASQSNVKEEAEWLIDVAISLLRLSQFELLNTSSHGFFPNIGKVEPMPSVIPESETRYLLMTADGISTGGMWMPPMYILDDAVIAATQTPEFKAKAQAIFHPTQNSLAERFGQGLGWLTRGRQSEDRAERFLFFFTAIEALLSSDDKTAPVVQNVARSAAVILGNDVVARAENAKKIKLLYAIRSALLHAGKRNVSKGVADTAQLITEMLYSRVMEHVPLTNSFESFQADLGRATYGLSWN
jgi:hypothetical protein